MALQSCENLQIFVLLGGGGGGAGEGVTTPYKRL